MAVKGSRPEVGSCFRSYIYHAISPDTIIPNPANPQSYNRYAYVLNNPLRYVDPSGHNPVCNHDGSICSDGAYDDGTVWVDVDARDLTSWIVEEMNFLPNIPEGESIHLGFDASYGGLGPNCPTCSYYMFYQIVADGAPLDVKDAMEEFGTIKLGDSWFEYSTAGNILYGFVGAAWGFAEIELHAGASVAQGLDWLGDRNTPLGPTLDTSDDYFAVAFGYQLYFDVYALDGHLTVSEFSAALENFANLSHMALQDPDVLHFSNPDWPYSQGYFYNTANPPNPADWFPTFAQQ